jgi:hypothetical protein
MAFAGCDAVPKLTFVEGDGDLDAPSDAEAPDVSNAPEAATTASPDAGCPDHPPAGATTCCHSVPCSGNCDAHCADCESSCSSSQLCCAKNTATCHMLTFICR